MTDTPSGSPPDAIAEPAPPTPTTATTPTTPTSPSASDPPGAPARRRWVLPAAGVLLLLIALWALAALRRPAPAVPTSTSAVASAPAALPVLAETMGEEGHLTIAVVSLDRVAGDTVELRVAVTNTAPAGSPALDIAQRFSADGPDRGTLAEVYLADLSHEHKFFVLRDGQNTPLGSRDVTPVAAGERRVLWARYPAPGDDDTEVVVHVPHAEPMPNVPVGVRSTSAESVR